MATTTINEVAILQYFEEQPIEKATVVYNLVRHKMEKRLQDAAPSSMASKRRRSKAETVPGQQPEPTPVAE
jgi:hypothetical protein